MKRFECKTDETGYTINKDGLGSFTIGTDRIIGTPKNAIIKCKCSILENHRKVTKEEKEKYNIQKGVKIWSEDFETFFDVIIFEEWRKDREYYVPVDFKFEEKITDKIASKRPTVLVWDNEEYKKEGILVAVADTGKYKYYAKMESGLIEYFRYCKLK